MTSGHLDTDIVLDVDVQIHTMGGTVILDRWMCLNTEVRELKRFVQTDFGVPFGRQRLFLRVRQLRNADCMSDLFHPLSMQLIVVEYVDDETEKLLLLRAATRGDFAQAERALMAPINPNVVDVDGMTPLVLAVKHGHVDMVRLVSDSMADVNMPAGPAGETPLHLAERFRQTAALLVLVDARADVNAISASGQTPLAAAASAGHGEAVGMLCDRRADLEKGAAGHTSLLLAVRQQRLMVVHRLCRAGANVNVLGTCDETPLIHAAYGGSLFIARELCRRGADTNIADDAGWLPLHVAAKRGDVDMVRYLGPLTQNKDSKLFIGGLTPLHITASRNTRTQAALALCEAGVNMDSVDQTGATPLFTAAYNGATDVVRLLCRLGVAVDKADDKSATPLSVGVSAGHLAVVSALLCARADRLQPDIAGRTPLQRAVAIERFDIARTLILGEREWGADVNSTKRLRLV